MCEEGSTAAEGEPLSKDAMVFWTFATGAEAAGVEAVTILGGSELLTVGGTATVGFPASVIDFAASIVGSGVFPEDLGRFIVGNGASVIAMSDLVGVAVPVDCDKLPVINALSV